MVLSSQAPVYASVVCSSPGLLILRRLVVGSIFTLYLVPHQVLASVVSKLHCLQDIVALAGVNKLFNAVVSSAALSLSVSQSLSNSSTPLEHDGARSSRILSVIRTQFSGM